MVAITPGNYLELSGIQNDSEDFNVIFLGNSAVGKSSLVQRLVTNSFSHSCPPRPTIGVDSQRRDLSVGARRLRLHIYDTQGQERGSCYGLSASYYRRAHAVVLIYDVTDETSFHGLGNWINEMGKYVCNGAVKLVVGNKAEDDLEEKREVSLERGLDFAKQFGMDMIEASAKYGFNTEEVVQTIASKLLQLRSTTIPKPSLEDLAKAVDVVKNSRCSC